MGFLNIKALSLKMRFIYSFVFVIIITITILSAVNHIRWNRNYLKQVRDEGLILTQTLAQGIMDPIVRNDFYTLNEYVNTLIKKKTIAYIVITDKHDHVLAQSPGALSLIPEPINSRVSGLDKTFMVQTYYNSDLETRINDISVPVVIELNKWGTVRVGFSLAYMQAEIARNLLVVMVTSLISILMGIGAGLILSRFVTEPIKKFSQSMETVASGNFEQEVSIDTADEFGLLARSFNEMAVSLKKNKLELEKTYQRLIQKEKMAALGELTARIAHEIKNPLGIIKGTAQILVDEKEPVDVKLEIAGFIIDEVNRLDAKVRDLLNHSRLQAPVLQKVSINDVLEDTIHIWEYQKREGKNITIFRNYDRNLPLLMLDREQMRQVILNLIINSCEAMPDGGRITVTAGFDFQKEDHPNCKGRKSVVVAFEDTGIGIHEKDLDRIFEPFFTTKKDGTGLGLATVNRIVENHKGKISVESRINAGTRFFLQFPINEIA